MNSEDDYMGNWLDIAGYTRPGLERDEALQIAKHLMLRRHQARLDKEAGQSYDFITVGDDGTIVAGTVTDGVTYTSKGE